MYSGQPLPCTVYDRFRREIGIAVAWRDVADAPDEPDPLPPSAGAVLVYQDRTWAHIELARLHFHPGEGADTIAYQDILADYAAGRCVER